MKGNGRMLRNLLTGALAGGLLLLPSGCGFFENAGTVSGTVQYKGQPLTEGSVSFVCGNGKAATGSIDQAGRYVVSHVPTGAAKVTVQVVRADGPPPMSFVGAPQSAQGATAGPKIPLRYSLAATSGLQLSVTKGKQQFNIDLQE
jgi:hypothetical protein